MMCSVSVWAAHPFPEEVYPGKYVYWWDSFNVKKSEVYGTVESGIYGINSLRLSYPITARCFDTVVFSSEITEKYGRLYYYDEYGSYYYWYENMYDGLSEEGQLRYLSNLWLDYYRIVDPEVWPEEYLDYFEEFLKNVQNTPSYLDSQKPQFRVADHEWNGRTVTVTCEADYDITYNHWIYELGPADYQDIIEVNNDFSAKACFAVTDKLSGELVYLVRHSSLVLEPDYVCRPGEYNNYNTLPCYPSELEGEHKGTVTKTMKATLPEFFDPEKYDVEVYFYTYGIDFDYGLSTYKDTAFHNAYDISPIKTIQGDVNGDGDVNAADAAALSRYLSGAAVEISAGADFNGDGVISAPDLLVLRRKLAGVGS